MEIKKSIWKYLLYIFLIATYFMGEGIISPWLQDVAVFRTTSLLASIIFSIKFLIYKVVFKLLGADARDIELLIVTGGTFVLSLLVASLLVGRMPQMAITVLVNLFEISIVSSWFVQGDKTRFSTK
jgi:hypothetical protein